MTVAWTTEAMVRAALASAAPPPGDATLTLCVDAANAASFRKRAAAGYTDPDDDDAPAPSPDIAMGATLWAVALWRERASTDSYPSFEELGTYTPTGSWGQIKRLLGIGRAVTDAAGLDDASLAWLRTRRRRRAWSR